MTLKVFQKKTNSSCVAKSGNKAGHRLARFAKH